MSSTRRNFSTWGDTRRVEGDGTLANKLLGSQVLDPVSIRVHDSILVEGRDVLLILVGSQSCTDQRETSGEHKVSDEQSAGFQERLYDGGQSCGWGGEVEGCSKSGGQERGNDDFAGGVHELGGHVEKEVPGRICDDYVRGVVFQMLILVGLSRKRKGRRNEGG